MKLRIKVSGHIAEYFPRGRDFELERESGGDVATVLAELGVPAGLVASVVVDGRRRPLTYTPQEGDEIVLLAPPGGG